MAIIIDEREYDGIDLELSSGTIEVRPELTLEVSEHRVGDAELGTMDSPLGYVDDQDMAVVPTMVEGDHYHRISILVDKQTTMKDVSDVVHSSGPITVRSDDVGEIDGREYDVHDFAAPDEMLMGTHPVSRKEAYLKPATLSLVPADD